MKKALIPFATVVAMLSTSAVAATVCSQETMAGLWFGGDSEAVCRIVLRENGRLRGYCIETWEDEINGDWVPQSERFELRGSFNVDTECKARLRLIVEDDGESQVVVFNGRFTGAASSRPDMGVLSTGPNSMPALNITLHRN